MIDLLREWFQRLRVSFHGPGKAGGHTQRCTAPTSELQGTTWEDDLGPYEHCRWTVADGDKSLAPDGDQGSRNGTSSSHDA